MDDTLSIRDRHRLETSAALHAKAWELAQAHGVEGFKVDDIALGVGVSRRTFFNYFATKEDAVLGIVPPTLSELARHEFSHGENGVLERTVHLFFEVARSTFVVGSTIEQRVKLRKKFPMLQSRFHLYMTAGEDLVRPLVEEVSDEESAEVILRLASAILRDAYRSNLDVTHESVEASIQKFQKVLRKVL